MDGPYEGGHIETVSVVCRISAFCVQTLTHCNTELYFRFVGAFGIVVKRRPLLIYEQFLTFNTRIRTNVELYLLYGLRLWALKRYGTIANLIKIDTVIIF